jgi:hypothetical protein
MIEVKNILVPTDFSDFSRYALDYALTMAQTFKARIILIHVTPEKPKTARGVYSSRIEEGVGGRNHPQGGNSLCGDYQGSEGEEDGSDRHGNPRTVGLVAYPFWKRGGEGGS